jgi:hypothetical protein
MERMVKAVRVAGKARERVAPRRTVGSSSVCAWTEKEQTVQMITANTIAVHA